MDCQLDESGGRVYNCIGIRGINAYTCLSKSLKLQRECLGLLDKLEVDEEPTLHDQVVKEFNGHKDNQPTPWPCDAGVPTARGLPVPSETFIVFVLKKNVVQH